MQEACYLRIKLISHLNAFFISWANYVSLALLIKHEKFLMPWLWLCWHRGQGWVTSPRGAGNRSICLGIPFNLDLPWLRTCPREPFVIEERFSEHRVKFFFFLMKSNTLFKRKIVLNKYQYRKLARKLTRYLGVITFKQVRVSGQIWSLRDKQRLRLYTSS